MNEGQLETVTRTEANRLVGNRTTKNKFDTIEKYKILKNKFLEIGLSKKVWISNPIIAALSDRKIDELIYYPVFNKQKKKELIINSNEADYIFLDSCDLACKPSDIDCENNKKELINFFKNKFIIKYSSELNECKQFVFVK